MPRAALFDMDRTLVRQDTASLYVRYQRDVGEADVRQQLRVAGWLLQYTAGLIDAPAVAEKALESFAGREERWMALNCRDWYRRYVRPHIAELGRERVKQHRARGEVLAIVTGATRYAAGPLSEELGVEHIVCSELEVSPNGRFTGRVVDPLCYGEGKIERTSRLARELGFTLEDATFYSDSITDRPLLEQVANPVVVNPDRRLRSLARRRGWPIERW
ncbi:MAG: HAD family hydrolase [Myxococcota bacterium]